VADEVSAALAAHVSRKLAATANSTAPNAECTILAEDRVRDSSVGTLQVFFCGVPDASPVEGEPDQRVDGRQPFDLGHGQASAYGISYTPDGTNSQKATNNSRRFLIESIRLIT
jgi:hypothetical protein